jgi:hypothetical protein
MVGGLELDPWSQAIVTKMNLRFQIHRLWIRLERCVKPAQERAEQLVITSMAMKTALVDAELRRAIEALVEVRSNSLKALAQGAELKVDKKLVEVKGASGSAVMRGFVPVQSIFFDIRITAMSGKMHTISYYCYRCRTIDGDTIQRGEALLGAVKFHVPQ